MLMYNFRRFKGLATRNYLIKKKSCSKLKINIIEVQTVISKYHVSKQNGLPLKKTVPTYQLFYNYYTYKCVFYKQLQSTIFENFEKFTLNKQSNSLMHTSIPNFMENLKESRDFDISIALTSLQGAKQTQPATRH